MIHIEMDKRALRQFRGTVDKWGRKTGKGIEEGVIELASASGRQLAQKLPPFGLSAAIGQKFQGSIGKQVNRAVSAGNVAGKSGSAAQIHTGFRDSKGQVPKGLKDRGQFHREPVPVGEKERLIDKKQAAAGIAKGAWVHAVETMGKKLSGIARWIRRHASRGQSTIRRKGFSTEVTLTNTVPWVQNVQTPAMVKSALQTAYRNTIKRMQRILDKASS